MLIMVSAIESVEYNVEMLFLLHARRQVAGCSSFMTTQLRVKST